MMIKYVTIGIIIMTLLINSVSSSVSASGPRGDSPEDGDASQEEDACWINGYDSGFAGKFDKGRNDECQDVNEEGENYYIFAWAVGCEDGQHNGTNRAVTGRSVWDCIKIMNNPVEIGDYEALEQEIISGCRTDGEQDFKEGNPFHEERSSACGEFGQPYRDGFEYSCQRNYTESHCTLLIEEEEYFCPDHPDIAGCEDFLKNATNKEYVAPSESESSYDKCVSSINLTCGQESNPEKYCLKYDDPAFCKTIGDLCDEDGFVKPEYPYCTA
jgi:hypothetical protein